MRTNILLKSRIISFLFLLLRPFEIIIGGILIWLSIWLTYDIQSSGHIFLIIISGLSVLDAIILGYLEFSSKSIPPSFRWRILADFTVTILYIVAWSLLYNSDHWRCRISNESDGNPPCFLVDAWLGVAFINVIAFPLSAANSFNNSFKPLAERMRSNYNARIGPDQPQAEELLDYAGYNGSWRQENWSRNRQSAHGSQVVVSGLSREQYEAIRSDAAEERAEAEARWREDDLPPYSQHNSTQKEEAESDGIGMAR